MADYETASRTKDHFQDQLLNKHPQIVSIAPRYEIGDEGLTRNAIIVIGISTLNPLRDARGQEVAPTPPIPPSLPAIDYEGNESRTETVAVVVEEEGDISAQMFVSQLRPCPGGFSVSHPYVSAGSIGGVLRIGGQWGYILSNNHILAAVNQGVPGHPTYQPGVADGGWGHTIGHLDRWVPIDFSGYNQVDCAVSRALDPWQQHVSRSVNGIGIPVAEADATPDQRVRKSGRTSQLSYGTILSTNATVVVKYGGWKATFVNQLQYTLMTSPGDSGALIFDRSSRTVLGLHFAASDSASYGNRIKLVISALAKARTVYNVINGQPSQWEYDSVSLIDGETEQAE